MVEMLDAQGVEVATMRAAVRSEDNRERILAAARSEFAQQGFRGPRCGRSPERWAWTSR